VRAAFGGAPWHVVSHGLVAIVSVILDDVIFGNPARDRLDTPACRPAVAAATREALAVWMDAAPDAVAEMRARIAEAKATGRRR
jgi:DNA gyrase/topoisomerase IV subunit B